MSGDRDVGEPAEPVRPRRKHDGCASSPGVMGSRVVGKECSIAMQCLDASPLALCRYARSQVPPRLDARWLPAPRLPEHGAPPAHPLTGALALLGHLGFDVGHAPA